MNRKTEAPLPEDHTVKFITGRAKLASDYLSEFPKLCEGFLEASGLPAGHFGVYAAGDPGFIYRLRRGKLLRVQTVQRVLKFIAEYPDSVARDVAK